MFNIILMLYSQVASCQRSRPLLDMTIKDDLRMTPNISKPSKAKLLFKTLKLVDINFNKI